MNNKVLLVYADNDEYKIESVWATKIGDYYRIDNIPFFAKNIAPGDIIAVEEDEGQFYFDSLVEASGNSVIRIVLYNEKDIARITRELELMGCNWEGSHLSRLISVEIPKEIPYNKIKEYLERERLKNVFDYQEACLGFK